MKKLLNVEMTQKQHKVLMIKSALFLTVAILIANHLNTPYTALNNALFTLFFLLTAVSSFKWVTAKVVESK